LRKKTRKKKSKPFPVFLLVLCLVAACLLFYSPKLFSFAVNNGPESAPVGESGEDIFGTPEPGDKAISEQPPSGIVQEPGENENENENGEEPAGITVPPERSENTFRHQAIVDELSFLQSPLPEAKVTTKDSQLPGAPRPYRNGTHEGLDYYNGYCGIPINYGDPVYAAGPGVILRIDHDYTEPETPDREEMLKISAAEGDTPAEILDILRGRQIWILHPNGTITRYAHLSKVAEGLKLGDLVEPGDLIGSIGNSGTSDGAEGSTANAHLHLEIWPGDTYLGKGLPPAEVRKILQKILE